MPHPPDAIRFRDAVIHNTLSSSFTSVIISHYLFTSSHLSTPLQTPSASASTVTHSTLSSSLTSLNISPHQLTSPHFTYRLPSPDAIRFRDAVIQNIVPKEVADVLIRHARPSLAVDTGNACSVPWKPKERTKPAPHVEATERGSQEGGDNSSPNGSKDGGEGGGGGGGGWGYVIG